MLWSISILADHNARLVYTWNKVYNHWHWKTSWAYVIRCKWDSKEFIVAASCYLLKSDFHYWQRIYVLLPDWSKLRLPGVEPSVSQVRASRVKNLYCEWVFSGVGKGLVFYCNRILFFESYHWTQWGFQNINLNFEYFWSTSNL